MNLLSDFNNLSNIYIGNTSLGLLALVYLLWNLIVFTIYGADKAKAKKDAWRIPEKTLLLLAFFMGGPGAFAGMRIFRHKTRHARFQVLVPLFAVLNLVFIGYLIFRAGFQMNNLH